MRRNNGGGFLFLLFFLFFFSGIVDLLGPLFLLLIVAGLGYGVYKSIQASKTNAYTSRNASARKSHTTRYGMNDTAHTADEKARVNTYLRKRFRQTNAIYLSSGTHNLVLTSNNEAFTNIGNLGIESDGTRFKSVAQFQKRFPGIYNQMFDTLLTMASNDTSVTETPIVDAEFSREEEVKQKEASKKVNKNPQNAEDFAYLINDYNIAIPDEEISNSLYETSALLKQLSELETAFPRQKSKLKKLYTNYLPYLMSILDQYVKMQYIQTDSNYQENVKGLKSTIDHINSAIKDRLIPEMSATDSSNLSADLSTLEAMLKKDGMTEDQDIMLQLKKEQKAAEKES